MLELALSSQEARRCGRGEATTRRRDVRGHLLLPGFFFREQPEVDAQHLRSPRLLGSPVSTAVRLGF